MELGSAINSMYRWYKNANICIAYLQDVCKSGAALEDSEWFRRGWTLQELIAPTTLEFFDRDWRVLGTKNDNVQLISSTTGIPVSILKNTSMLTSCSVAQRMSWAANRTTERLEDRAYSLLGLFDVSLEMIYGELEKAFIRLQEKIIQQSADQSVFAWMIDAEKSDDNGYGLLATSPSRFHASGDVAKGIESQEFSTTNLGLTISFMAVPYDIDTYLAFLDCSLRTKPTQVYGIFLSRLKSNGQWARVSVNGCSVLQYERELINKVGTIQIDIRVRQTPASQPIRANQIYGFWLRELTPPYHEGAQIRILSRLDISSPADHRVTLVPGLRGTAGTVSIEPEKVDNRWSRVHWMKVGFDDHFQPTVMIANSRSQAINNFQTLRDFEEAETLGPGSAARQKLFDDSWLCTGEWKDSQHTPSIENGWAKGYNILKHPRDRWPDQNYDFPALNLRISFSLVPNVKPNAHHSSSKLIWAIDVTTIGDSMPKRERNIAKCEAWAMAVAGCPFLLCGWGAPYQYGQGRIEQMTRSNYK